MERRRFFAALVGAAVVAKVAPKVVVEATKPAYPYITDAHARPELSITRIVGPMQQTQNAMRDYEGGIEWCSRDVQSIYKAPPPLQWQSSEIEARVAMGLPTLVIGGTVDRSRSEGITQAFEHAYGRNWSAASLKEWRDGERESGLKWNIPKCQCDHCRTVRGEA